MLAYGFLFSADDTVAGHFRRYSLSWLARVMDRMLAAECGQIAAGRLLAFGGSCLVAAVRR